MGGSPGRGAAFAAGYMAETAMLRGGRPVRGLGRWCAEAHPTGLAGKRS
jgi:hypothetical protein